MNRTLKKLIASVLVAAAALTAVVPGSVAQVKAAQTSNKSTSSQSKKDLVAALNYVKNDVKSSSSEQAEEAASKLIVWAVMTPASAATIKKWVKAYTGALTSKELVAFKASLKYADAAYKKAMADLYTDSTYARNPKVECVMFTAGARTEATELKLILKEINEWAQFENGATTVFVRRRAAMPTAYLMDWGICTTITQKKAKRVTKSYIASLSAKEKKLFVAYVNKYIQDNVTSFVDPSAEEDYLLTNNDYNFSFYPWSYKQLKPVAAVLAQVKATK